MHSLLKEAVRILKDGKYTCVVLETTGKRTVSYERGIKPLMQELRKDRQAFTNSVVADKVIGKAAAMMCILGNAKAVYADVMSEEAKEILNRHQVICEYDTLVPFIENRTKTGRCPMETAVLGIEDLEEAYNAVEETIAKLMKAGT